MSSKNRIKLRRCWTLPCESGALQGTGMFLEEKKVNCENVPTLSQSFCCCGWFGASLFLIIASFSSWIKITLAISANWNLLSECGNGELQTQSMDHIGTEEETVHPFHCFPAPMHHSAPPPRHFGAIQWQGQVRGGALTSQQGKVPHHCPPLAPGAPHPGLLPPQTQW